MTRLSERHLLPANIFFEWHFVRSCHLSCVSSDTSGQSISNLNLMVVVRRQCHLQALQSRSWILLPRGNNQEEGFYFAEILGLTVFMFALSWESLADMQKQNFLKAQKKKELQDRLKQRDASKQLNPLRGRAVSTNPQSVEERE